MAMTTELPPGVHPAVRQQAQPLTPAQNTVASSDLPGIKVMLVGAPGTGKTHALHTLVDAGIEPYVLFTENSMGVLGPFAGSKDDCKIHWNYVKAADADWAAMLDIAQKVNTMSNDMLQKMPGINKQKYAQYFDLLNGLAKPKCQRCGKEFEPVDNWGTDKAVVLDSLSGLNTLIKSLTTGAKPILTQPDWGVSMGIEEQMLQKLVNLDCHFIMTAHLDRTFDEVQGSVSLTPSALGKKLGPVIPRWFDDVIMSIKTGAEFSWTTAKANVDLKSRHLDFKDKLPPTFELIIENWKQKGGVIGKR